MKKKILITGSNGFIGSFLVDEALRLGYDVFAGVRENSNRQFLAGKPVRYLIMDLSNSKGIESLIRDAGGFDYVIHNAGLTRYRKREDYEIVNVQYTRNLIEAITASGHKPGKFIFISSLAAFGPGDPLKLTPVMLADVPRPLTAYGRSKLKSEEIVSSLSDFPFLIFRPTAVYGPRDKEFCVYFRLIKKHLELYVGKPNPCLTFIYVKDLAKAVFAGIESTSENKSYFVTDGKVYHARTFAEIIKKKLGKKTIRVYVPVSIAALAAGIVQLVYAVRGLKPVLNFEKIKELRMKNWKCEYEPLQTDLKFKADYELEKGVGETIDWYRDRGWL